MILPKKLINRIIIAIPIAIFAGIAALYGFRRQGGNRVPELTVGPEAVTELRLRVGDTSLRLSRRVPDAPWVLTHPAYAHPVAADERAVESLLDALRHWEIRTLTPADSLRSGPADITRLTHADASDGRLRVYTEGRLGRHKAWDRRWRRTGKALYLRENRHLYARLYDPRQADAAGEAALAAAFTATARYWRHKWICHYYYYDIARAEWQSADGHFICEPAADVSASTAAATALSAFRGVHFDRYAEASDSAVLADALSRPPVALFSVVSTAGDSTHLAAYTLYDTAGRADWFRLCGLLTQSDPQMPATPPARPGTDLSPDTVFLSYQLLDRLRAAITAAGSTPAIPRP